MKNLRQKNKSEQGFGIIEIFLVVIVVVVLGATGWYAVHTKHQTDEILAQADRTSQSSPSAKNSSLQASSAKDLSVNLNKEALPPNWTAQQVNSENYILLVNGSSPNSCFVEVIKVPDVRSETAQASEYSQKLYNDAIAGAENIKGYSVTKLPNSLLTLNITKQNQQLLSDYAVFSKANISGATLYQKTAYIIGNGYYIHITISCPAAAQLSDAEKALLSIEIL